MVTVAEAVAAFGREARSKLSSAAIKGQPEDQLRNPLERLFDAMADVCKLVVLTWFWSASPH